MTKTYVIQSKGQVGNCMMFWAQGGHGYTCNLAEAWKVSLKEAKKLCTDRPEKDRFLLYDDVLKHSYTHVDVQEFPWGKD